MPPLGEDRMWGWIKQLDRLLRGEATSLPELQRGRFDIPVVGLCVVIAVLGLIYGACMGLFAVTGSGSGYAMQIPASMVKVPALFFLTLIVTFPSLYVFNALVGSRLSFIQVLRLLIGSLAITLAVLASLGPIVAFFAISTTSYPFMKLLNVAVFALSGFLGLAFLLQTLHRMAVTHLSPPPSPTAQPSGPPPPPRDPDAPMDVMITDPSDPRYTGVPIPTAGALERVQGHVLGPHTKTIFRIWVIVFGFVGTQMAWVLRPFIGRPDVPFTWFRHRESNFFQALWEQIAGFFTGR